MRKYEATYSFNVRRHLRVEIEASDACEAERLARKQAAERIDAEIVQFQNADGFSDTDPLDPVLSLDECDPAEGAIVVCEGESLAVELGMEDAKNG
jgi:hypothetical protein